MPSTLLNRIYYPAVILLAVGLMAGALVAGVPLVVAPYMAVAVAGILIVLGERIIPYRREWTPTAPELIDDGVFLILVQILLPLVLGWIAIFGVQRFLEGAGLTFNLWPSAWPIAAQVLLKILAGDLLRYWLHRASHTASPLWRLHAVHHAPTKLYALNVFRFHPLDKMLQFLGDTLPFILLGVGPEVLAFYFVIYAVSGLFQHSNIDVRLGWLNYLISGPEVHRWHHSRVIAESNANYAHTFAGWDVLFGTWRRPADHVGPLGLLDNAYPRRFLGQMAAPFRRGPVSTHAPRNLKPLARIAFEAAMAIQGRSALHALLRAAEQPARAQERALRAIVEAHRGTAFGRDHGYDRIRDMEDFRAALPIRDYEGVRPWIEHQVRTGEPAFNGQRPLMYARTSGTTGAPKLVPVTPVSLERLKRAQRAGAYVQHRTGGLFAGRILALVGAVREDSLPDGTPVGSATGLIYASMPAVVRSRYVVPPAVFAIDDPDLKYRIVTRLALQHADLSAVSTANPSSLLRLRDTSRENWAVLLAQIADGSCPEADALPDEQRRAVQSALRADPLRAASLAAAALDGEPTIEQLWPHLAGVVTWTGGSCALAAETVADTLPPGARLIEAGYVSSEFRGTVVVDATQDFGLPLLDDVVFEFVPTEAWDAGSRDTLLIHELEEGGDYQVIVTTFAGFARYHINDVVRVGPRVGATPTLKFLRKGRGVTSITGEKLTEDQVNAAVGAATRRLGLHAPFHLILADEVAAGYAVLLELEGPADPADLAAALDAGLRGLNIEYDGKRATGRLRPLEVRLLRPGAGAAYRTSCVAGGQRDAQFKVLALQYARECRFDFNPWRRTDAGHPAQTR